MVEHRAARRLGRVRGEHQLDVQRAQRLGGVHAGAVEQLGGLGERLALLLAGGVVLAPAADPLALLGDVGELQLQRAGADVRLDLVVAEPAQAAHQRLARGLVAAAQLGRGAVDPGHAVGELAAVLLGEHGGERAARGGRSRARRGGGGGHRRRLSQPASGIRGPRGSLRQSSRSGDDARHADGGCGGGAGGAVGGSGRGTGAGLRRRAAALGGGAEGRLRADARDRAAAARRPDGAALRHQPALRADQLRRRRPHARRVRRARVLRGRVAADARRGRADRLRLDARRRGRRHDRGRHAADRGRPHRGRPEDRVQPQADRAASPPGSPLRRPPEPRARPAARRSAASARSRSPTACAAPSSSRRRAAAAGSPPAGPRSPAAAAARARSS